MFFYLSKIFWFALNPFNMFFLLLFIAFLLRKIGWKRISTVMALFASISIVTISIYPIGDHLLYPLESRFIKPDSLPENVKGIIVLGGSVELSTSNYWNSCQQNGNSERTIESFVLAQKLKDIPLIFTGGNGGFTKYKKSESDFAESLYIDLGLAKERIIVERKSRNTYENALFTKELLQSNNLQANSLENKVDGKWILVTSASHMPRSVATFRKVGWDVIPYPVDFKSSPPGDRHINFHTEKNLKNLKYAIHEWIGMIAYYYSDKASEIYPN